MKTFALAALGAALASTVVVSTAEAQGRHWRHHHGGWHRGAWVGGAAGLATGLIVGGALAGAYSPYYYGGGPYYAAPGPYYYGAPVVTYRSRANPNCVATTRYDGAGRPFEWWDCR